MLFPAHCTVNGMVLEFNCMLRCAVACNSGGRQESRLSSLKEGLAVQPLWVVGTDFIKRFTVSGDLLS